MKQLLAFLASLFGAGKKKKPPVIIVPPVIVPTKPVRHDMRAIGMVMLANYKEYTGHENYGNGDQSFDEWIIAFANHCITNLRQLNAQGAIIWDGEGARFPRSYTYIGDPRLTPVKIDPFFAALSAAGFRTGVCLRPDEVRMTFNAEWGMELPHHFTVASPLENLATKVEYARKRWGCTLFYVDSNVGEGQGVGVDNTGGFGKLIPGAVFAELHKMFHDCLFIPEWTDEAYRPHTFPYYHKSWPYVSMTGNVIDCGDTKWTAEQLRDAVKQGNILMSRAWWGPEIELVKQAYIDAGQQSIKD